MLAALSTAVAQVRRVAPDAPRTLPLPSQKTRPENNLVSIRLSGGRAAPSQDSAIGKAAARILRVPPRGFATMDAFGKALGWGGGPRGNAVSFARAASITLADVTKLGVTSDEATRIRDAYRAVVSLPKGATNPNALGRAVLLGRVVALLA